MYFNWLKLLWQEFKVATPVAMWLLPLLTVGGLLLLLDTRTDESSRSEYVALMVEVVFPLGIMYVANGLILREREKNTLAFIATRSSLSVVWLRRLAALFIGVGLCLGILLLIYWQFYLHLHVGKMFLASLAVSLVLTSMSSVISLFTKEMNTGYLIGTLWWALSLMNPKVMLSLFSPYLYLFYFWFSAKENLAPDLWLANKLSLLGVATMLGLVCVQLLRSTERFVT